MGEQAGPADATSEGPSSRHVAARWLAHPISIAAIIVLVVNDHVLKAEFGTWWTGKLSDVAGLVYFPALGALVLSLVWPRVTFRPLMTTAIAATGIGFIVVKATATGAATASAVLTALAGPSTVLRDPTDLIALASLGLAAWTARASMREDPHARRARWRAALVLPVAVAASVATSAPVDMGVTTVEPVGDQVWAGVHSVDGAGAHPDEIRVGRWYVLQPDGIWEGTLEGDPATVVAQSRLSARENGPEQRCSTSDPELCFRPLRDAQGVEVSHDGGASWQVDWEISDAALADLAERRNTRTTALMTAAVAVIDSEAGMQVYAANGVDGLAVRAPDGTWERIGLPGYESIPRPLALLDDRSGHPTYALPLGIAFGIAAAGPMVLALTIAWSRRRPTGTGRGLAAALLTVPSALCAVWTINLTASYTGDDAPPNVIAIFPLVVVAAGAMSMAGFVLAAFLVSRWHPRVVGYACGFGLLLSVLVALVAQALDHHTSLAITAGVVLALMATLAVAVRIPPRSPQVLAPPLSSPADAVAQTGSPNG